MQKYRWSNEDIPVNNGKYKSTSASDALAVYTRYVANELAEANRLKRIELMMLSGNYKLNDFKELEDQA